MVGFPTKNDQHLGCEMGVPPFKETPIYCPPFSEVVTSFPNGYVPILRG